MTLSLSRNLAGRILDVGGGGEAVIGRIYRQQVIAIDNRQDELDEAPDVCAKRLMDAACLAFPDAAFDHVTFFYSLMYMDMHGMLKQTQAKALCEAARVLKTGGMLHIWDAAIASAFPEPFIARLEIDAAGEAIRTAYGIVRADAAQNARTIAALCEAAGLLAHSAQEADGHFYLQWAKPVG